MRQISTSPSCVKRTSTSESCPWASTRHRAALADRAEAGRTPRRSAASSLPRPPAAGSSPRLFELDRFRCRRSLQHDLRAPPGPVLVALGLVHDQAGGLEVVEPALQATAVRPHEPRTLY